MLLDFSKAFDKVPHTHLCNKLHHYGIHGALLSWLQAFLHNRSQYVIVDNQRSHLTPVLSGVPQGTVLVPLLFLIYINDLPSCVHNKIRLYADDVLLYSYIQSQTDCTNLQQDLNSLLNWSHIWQMSLNPKKCEFLRITNKKYPVTSNYFIDSSPIKEVSHSKYLGVIIDNKLSWNPHIQHITTKATQVNPFLYRNLPQCPTSVKSTCYKSMVRPIIEYASSVWDSHTTINIQKLESIQKRAARFCFNNFSKYCSVSSLHQHLVSPHYSLEERKAKLVILYKLINGILCIPTDNLFPIYPVLRSGYYKQLSTRNDSYKFSFFPSTIKLWNSLPLL